MSDTREGAPIAERRGEADPYPDIGYDQRYRPQFHFTSKRNWINDPNGCVYYDGEYHLFFQHDPESVENREMSWGHALSTDLVHWRQLPHAISPDEHGPIWSGSAVVDARDTAGFASGGGAALVAAFTYAGSYARGGARPFTQGIVYSVDRGRTWMKYTGNPVLDNQSGGGDRDPKLFWHEPTGQWVMVLYLDKGPRRLAFFTSSDLKRWTKESEIDGFYECPDLFELPVDGEAANTRWVLLAADGKYVLGRFDGSQFTTEAGKFVGDWGANFYASQTFNNVPGGRRVQIAWMNGGSYPEMPFNQQSSFPCELTLRTTPDGIRLHREPVREIASLQGDVYERRDLDIVPGENPLREAPRGDAFDIELEVETNGCSRFGLHLHGQDIECCGDALRCLGRNAPLSAPGGVVRLRVLVDRTSIEVFASGGAVSMSSCFLPGERDTDVALFASGRTAVARSVKVRRLGSAWGE
jgi:fructan beta-fructosidase